MSLRLASRLRLFIFILKLIWRNVECQYLARIANQRIEYLERLVVCAGTEFMRKDSRISGIGWHTQPLPGYCMNNGAHTSNICWEAPICITIYHDDTPLVGMALEFRGPVLCIRQLQGSPNTEIPEHLRQWPKLFVEAMKLFLFNTKEITSLRLYCADQRPSYRHPHTRLTKAEMERYQQNLRRRYDGTARQSGMKKVSPKYWEWDLSMLPKRDPQT